MRVRSVAIKGGKLRRRIAAVMGATLAPAAASAAVSTFSTQSAFTAASGPIQTATYETDTPGTVVPSGSAVDGTTFTYSISDGTPTGHLNMKVDDQYYTTSGNNYLTLNDPLNYSLFLSGDVFTMNFAPTHAIGLYFITADSPDAATISLATSSGTAENSSTPDVNLPASTFGYFVGLVDTSSTFSTATITTVPGTAPFYFYLDDLSEGVPEPASQWGISAGGSWNLAGDWSPAGIPNGKGTRASFLSSPGLTNSGIIKLDGSKTVGQITFNNASSYTISQGSGGSLTIDDSGDLNVNPQISVITGSHFISAPMILANGLNVNFSAGTGLTVSGTISGAGAIAVSGAGTLTIAPGGVLPSGSGLSILNGAKVALASVAHPLSSLPQTVQALSLDTSSKLDISNNELIVSGTQPSTIRGEIKTGQIYSSQSDTTHGVGYIPNLAGTEIRYAVLGDCNLDGSVNFSDLLTLAANYGASNATWSVGDFNYDNTVNFSDLLALAANYGSSLTPAQSSDLSPNFAADWQLALSEVSSVPEPASTAVALAAGVMFVMGRPRQKRTRFSNVAAPSCAGGNQR